MATVRVWCGKNSWNGSVPVPTLTQNHSNRLELLLTLIVVLPSIDVMTHCNSTPEWVEEAYQLREFPHQWPQCEKYCHYQPLFTTQDEMTIFMYVMDNLRILWYWTLWMSKKHVVTFHQVMTVYNDMFGHMDIVM
jgi:hypothetical protein